MKLWGGRFTRETAALMDDFHSSIHFDQRLYRQDIAGSIAHATMLGECGIITREEAQRIVQGLQEIQTEIEAGKITFDPGAEDIHMNIEKLLIERIGDTGRKLHTARSRNDQVALDTRLYLKEEIRTIQGFLLDLNEVCLDLGEKHLDVIMPGYTHLQRAQPVLFAHHLLAYVEMFSRDWERLEDCYRRTDVLPLGAGALAGTTFPIDRARVAALLGFGALAANSLDAVSDRDFVVEFLAAAALIMTHLSRLGEELVLWSSAEFGFIELSDAYATGSSIMPQKKNPDVAELVRGKAGRVYGDLMAVLTMLKGLPLAYNKDLQEDKERLFDAVDTVKMCLQIFTPMLATMTLHPQRMRAAAAGGFSNATDVADYLARKGVPFREAHAIVGRIVLTCLQEGKDLTDLTLAEWRAFSPAFGEDIFSVLSLESCIAARNVFGGTATAQVQAALARGRAELARRRRHNVGEKDQRRSASALKDGQP